MKYMLVIQFPGKSETDYGYLIEIEAELEEQFSDASEVDGHDFGSGEMNIFVLTNEPIEAFRKVKIILEENSDRFSVMKAAYRDIDSEEFTVLWPDNLTEFIVK